MTAKQKEKRLVIHWWEDAYGRHTCHRNDGGSFKDSLLGGVEFDGQQWYYRLTGQERVGPYKHIMAAKKALQDAVGGAPIDIWD